MKTSKILIAFVALALIVAIAAAVYTMNSDPSDTVVVNPTPTPTASPSPSPPPQATLSKVSVSTTMLTVGESLTLSTTVSDDTAGLTVNFYDQENTLVGTAVTDSTGTASLTIQPPIGSWSYHATAEHP